MAENSKISWTTHTFNPWIGCSKVHDGCTKCYAEAFAKRTNKAQWGVNGTRVKTSPAYWDEPLAWNKMASQGLCATCSGRGSVRAKQADGSRLLERCGACNATGRVAPYRPRVFCASLADVFEDWQGEMRCHKGGVLHRCSAGHLVSLEAVYANGTECQHGCDRAAHPLTMGDAREMLFTLIDDTPHLDWLLLTKRPENVPQMWPEYSYHACVTGDCPHELQSECNSESDRKYRDNVWLGTSISNQETADVMVPRLRKCRALAPVLFLSAEPLLGQINFVRCPIFPFIDQVIFGVESSGPRVGRLGSFASEREMVDAIQSGVQQCAAAGVAAFVKQIPIKGFVSHEPAEWIPELRVREFPRSATSA